MRRSLYSLDAVFFVVCALHIPSIATGEMLLAEITYTTPEPVSAPASFVFGVGNNFIESPTFHNWIEMVPAFPYTSTADLATVAAFDRLLTTFAREDGVLFGLTNGPYAPPRPADGPLFLDRAFAGEYVDRGVTATRYLPPIGETSALQWYALTGIHRSATAMAQTIRIFGFAVPEPTTWLLTVLGGVLQVSMCRACPACGHRRRGYRRR
jgi:hypothetical protein